MLLIIIWTHHLNYFFSLVLASNNLPLKIYCENIIVSFLSFNFLFLFYLSLYLFFFHPHVYLYFFFLFFSPPHMYSLPTPYFHFWLFFMHFIFTRLPFVFFLFLFLYFPPHIQLHSPLPCISWPWSSQVISLNFTKNLQYLSLFVTPKPNGNWT